MPASVAERANVRALTANLSPKKARAKVVELALVEWEAGQRGHGYYRTATKSAKNKFVTDWLLLHADSKSLQLVLLHNKYGQFSKEVWRRKTMMTV